MEFSRAAKTPVSPTHLKIAILVISLKVFGRKTKKSSAGG